MPIYGPVGGRSSGRGGLTLGPVQNEFATNAARNTYASANSAWLAQYNGNRQFLILVGGTEYQRRNVAGNAWEVVTNVAPGARGPTGPPPTDAEMGAVVGRLLGALSEFTYDSGTNTFTFAIPADTITAAMALTDTSQQKAAWRDAIEAVDTADLQRALDDIGNVRDRVTLLEAGALTNDDVRDLAGALLATLSEFTYNPTTNTLTFTGGGGGQGGGLTADQATDAAGALLDSLVLFNYNANTNTLSVVGNSIRPALIEADTAPQQAAWRTRIGAASEATFQDLEEKTNDLDVKEDRVYSNPQASFAGMTAYPVSGTIGRGIHDRTRNFDPLSDQLSASYDDEIDLTAVSVLVVRVARGQVFTGLAVLDSVGVYHHVQARDVLGSDANWSYFAAGNRDTFTGRVELFQTASSHHTTFKGELVGNALEQILTALRIRYLDISDLATLGVTLQSQREATSPLVVRFTTAVAGTVRGVAYSYAAQQVGYMPPGATSIEEWFVLGTGDGDSDGSGAVRGAKLATSSNIPTRTAPQMHQLDATITGVTWTLESGAPAFLSTIGTSTQELDFAIGTPPDDVIGLWFVSFLDDVEVDQILHPWNSHLLPDKEGLRFSATSRVVIREQEVNTGGYPNRYTVEGGGAPVAANSRIEVYYAVAAGGGAVDVSGKQDALTNQQKSELLGIRVTPNYVIRTQAGLQHPFTVQYHNPELLGSSVWLQLNIGGFTLARQQLVAAGTDRMFTLTADQAETIATNLSGETELHLDGRLFDASTGGNELAEVPRYVSVLEPPPTIPSTDPVVQTLTSAAAVTFAVGSGTIADLVLGHNVTLTISGGVDGSSALLRAQQDATGSRTLTFASGIQLDGRTAPTLSTGASERDLLYFHRIGTNWHYVGIVQNG